MKQPDVIMTSSEVAGYLRLPIRTVYKLSHEGKLPATKIGKHWRFRKDKLDQWFDENNGTERKP
jgi:excisionase family DNA binding protein